MKKSEVFEDFSTMHSATDDNLVNLPHTGFVTSILGNGQSSDIPVEFSVDILENCSQPKSDDSITEIPNKSCVGSKRKKVHFCDVVDIFGEKEKWLKILDKDLVASDFSCAPLRGIIKNSAQQPNCDGCIDESEFRERYSHAEKDSQFCEVYRYFKRGVKTFQYPENLIAPLAVMDELDAFDDLGTPDECKQNGFEDGEDGIWMNDSFGSNDSLQNQNSKNQNDECSSPILENEMILNHSESDVIDIVSPNSDSELNLNSVHFELLDTGLSSSHIRSCDINNEISSSLDQNVINQILVKEVKLSDKETKYDILSLVRTGEVEVNGVNMPSEKVDIKEADSSQNLVQYDREERGVDHQNHSSENVDSNEISLEIYFESKPVASLKRDEECLKVCTSEKPDDENEILQQCEDVKEMLCPSSVHGEIHEFLSVAKISEINLMPSIHEDSFARGDENKSLEFNAKTSEETIQQEVNVMPKPVPNEIAASIELPVFTNHSVDGVSNQLQADLYAVTVSGSLSASACEYDLARNTVDEEESRLLNDESSLTKNELEDESVSRQDRKSDSNDNKLDDKFVFVNVLIPSLVWSFMHDNFSYLLHATNSCDAYLCVNDGEVVLGDGLDNVNRSNSKASQLCADEGDGNKQTIDDHKSITETSSSSDVKGSRSSDPHKSNSGSMFRKIRNGVQNQTKQNSGISKVGIRKVVQADRAQRK